MSRRSRRLVTPALLTSLALVGTLAAYAGVPQSPRAELARLDALLAAGDESAAAALLQTLEPDLARDDRLALDTIYVLVARARFAEARAQWNRLAPRIQERLRTAQPGTGAGAEGGSPGDSRQRWAAEAMFAQGLLTARSGEKAEALKLLQQADGLGFPPLESPLMLLAAATLSDLQEHELAASAYRQFLDRQPSNTTARFGLARSLYAARQFADAQRELEGLLSAAPGTPLANYTLGAVLFEQHRYAEARVHLARELALDPRCTPCLSRLAHIAYLEGDDAACESLLQKARAIDPTDLETDMVSGLLAFRTGRYPEAVEHFSRVVARSPSYTTAQYQLAMAYRRAGDDERARQHFEVYQRLLKEQKARENAVRGEQ